MAAKSGGGGGYRPNKPKGGGKKRGYDWGDGKGPVHSRPKLNRPRSGGGGGAGPSRPQPTTGTEYLGAPLPIGQIDANARQAATARYAAPLGALDTRIAQVPAWFDAYRASIQTPQQTQQMYQPAIAQSQANEQQTGQTLGLQGPAGEQDALAAQARQALVKLGTSQLLNAETTQETYNQGRQGVAQAAQVGAQFQLGQQRQELLGERGAYQGTLRAQGIADERQYGLGLQHQANENKAFGLDVFKAQTDAQATQQKIRANRRKTTAAARAKGQEVNKYGYSNEQWGRFSPSHRQRIMRQQAAKAPGAANPRFTPEQVQKSNATLRRAVALVKAELGPNTQPDAQGRVSPSSPDFWEKAYAALIQNKNMDPAIARAAIQILRLGKPRAGVRKTLLDDYGITSFPKGKRPKQPKPTTISRPGNAPSSGGYRPT